MFRIQKQCGRIAVTIVLGCSGAFSPAQAPRPEAVDSPAAKPPGNPVITDIYTADPAPLVVGDTVYLYTGHDEAKGDEQYRMNDYHCFSSKDLKTWTPHGALLSYKDFKWAKGDAWASQVIEKNGKCYWYCAVQHDDTKPGKSIGVAVADGPLGPFKDARGSALVTDDMTKGRGWDDIDPTVYTDSDGVTWMFWGWVGNCYFAKLKPNMIEIDGEITKTNPLPGYIEGPWIHKRGNLYYLSYASMNGNRPGGTSQPARARAETISYATAESLAGPWTPRGLLAEPAANSFTIHPGIIEFKGQWYFFYHNGRVKRPIDGGGSFRRSVCIDYLYYNEDGTIKPIVQTTEGVTVPPKSQP